MNEHFWEEVKSLLKSKGLTQVDFAKSLNIPVRTFQDWSTTKRFPDMDTCYRIASELGVTLDYLLTGNSGSLRNDEVELLAVYNQIPEQFRTLAHNAVKALLPLGNKE